MNITLSPRTEPEDEFGHKVVARLSAGNLDISHDVGERLRVARTQAIARRKTIAPTRVAPVVVAQGGAATLGASWWTRIGSVVPLVALVGGLLVISVLQDDNRANELAEIDSALLTGDLPPAAYTDPGFAQFLKADAQNER